MRILLTGGTGLIGQALCQHWQRQGHELWVWSRDPHKVQRLCSGAQGIAQLQAQRQCAAGRRGQPGGRADCRPPLDRCAA